MAVRILVGDVRAQLRGLASSSVDMVVTSPPYWGLRSYLEPDHPDKPLEIGAEDSLATYLETLVTVFGEVRRVLRDDGTLWLNIGDSYAGSWGAQGRRETASNAPSWHGNQIRNHPKRAAKTGTIRDAGLKPKDLMMVPARLALALQADGWWVRQDIIWSKPNPMPESIADRCTKAHEYLFLLSKSETYHFDAAAIAEPASRPEGPKNKSHRGAAEYEKGDERRRTTGGLAQIGARETRNKRSVWTVPVHPFKEGHFATFPPALIEPCILAGSRPGGVVLDPFFGSGTTGLVADRLGRACIGIELNATYAEIAQRRLMLDGGMLMQVEVAA